VSPPHDALTRFGRLIGVLVLVAVSCGACGGGASEATHRARPIGPSSHATPPMRRTVSSTTFPVGTLSVGVHADVWVDASRRLPPNGGAPSAPQRSMPTTIWYPAVGRSGAGIVHDAAPDRNNAPFPLVVFAHGFAVTPLTYNHMLARWASAGYVVVAPAIPLLNADAPGGPSHADYGSANLADFEFAVSEAVRRARTPGDLLAGVVDPDHIAVAGHSDGEVLAYLLAFAPCCYDRRVKAGISMAGNLDNARQLPASTGVPLLHVMSELDEYNPYPAAIAFDRAHLASPHYLLTLRGAQHQSPYVDPADAHFDVVVAATVDFLDVTLKARPEAVARLSTDIAAAGPGAQLEESPKLAPPPS